MLKHLISFILSLSIVLLSACSSVKTLIAQDSGVAPTLVVSGEDLSKTYTRLDLEGMTTNQAVFNEVPYKGVTVSALLMTAGFDLARIKAVKAVAEDGYTVNYDSSQILADGVIVAYARVDGDLAEEDGSFRIVMPGAEGKLNVRMLVELQVIQ